MGYFSNFLNLLFPSKCPICADKSDSLLYNPICTRCWSSIERYLGPACNICGIPTISNQTLTCKSCIMRRPSFAKILYYGIYDGVLKEVIHLLKFNRVKRLSKPLSDLLSELPIPNVDAIIPVPLYKKRLKAREFNQTAALGYHLSKILKIPIMLDVLRKIKDTRPQTELNGIERLKNIKNAYAVSSYIKGLDLLLIDDVITTGATIQECSETLIKAGAKSVTALAIARSMPKL